jgi:hypothetical protein
MEINILSEKGKDRSEARLHKAIDGIVGSWKDFVHIRVKRKGRGKIKTVQVYTFI